MMRKVALVLALSLVVAGGALAVNPSLMAGGAGPHQQYDSGRPDVVWSEPPDVERSDRVVGSHPDIGLESEIANDFVLDHRCLHLCRPLVGRLLQQLRLRRESATARTGTSGSTMTSGCVP